LREWKNYGVCGGGKSAVLRHVHIPWIMHFSRESQSSLNANSGSLHCRRIHISERHVTNENSISDSDAFDVLGIGGGRWEELDSNCK
jgi:hypothetical protein